MSDDLKTIRVPADAFEAAQEAKKPGETWGEYVRRCSDDPPEIRRFVDTDSLDVDHTTPEIDVGHLVDQLVPELSGMTVTLESTEHKKIGNEIEGRLR